MTEQNPPAIIQGTGVVNHPASTILRSFMGLVPYAMEGVGRFNGSNDLKVVQNSPAAMNVRVNRGFCFVKGDDVTDQGLYGCYNDGYVTLAVAAAHASLARKDIVYAEVNDSFHGQAGDSWSLAVATGVPDAAPADPALPATAYKLASIHVAAGAASIVDANITDRRKPVMPLFGVETVPFNGQARADGGVEFEGYRFSQAPIVIASVEVAGYFDILCNVTAIGDTFFNYTLYSRELGNRTGTAYLHWTAFERV